MRSPDHTRLAAQLPPVYHEDAASFRQVDDYLGLVDELLQDATAELEDTPLTLGPDHALRWPARLPLDAGGSALLDRYLQTSDDVATWVAYAFPASWGRDETGLARRRRFLARAARLWRRRGTPRGFLDWFCLYFGIETETDRPFLLEHFKVPDGPADTAPYTATLFVPATPSFADHRRRLETSEFARWYAPAHIALRVCYVRTDLFGTFAPFAQPAVLPPAPTQDDLDRYLERVVEQGRLMNELLCSVVSVVGHGGALHLVAPGTDERPVDQLDVGLLPHSGD